MRGCDRQRRSPVFRQGGARIVTLALCLLPPLSAFPVVPLRAAELPLPAATPWQVTADKISRFVNPPSIIAEGHVVLSRQGVTSLAELAEPKAPQADNGPKPLTISGDWIRLDPVTNQVRVRGHAVLDSEEEHVTADLADLDMNRQTGHLERATIHFPKRSLYLAGATVEKTGDLTYHLEEGWVTRCAPQEGLVPPWSFGWQRADITQEGFAHFTHTTFRVKDVPVVYSPYVGFPTSRKRKSGVLLPEWTGGERDGAGLLVPLFVSLSPSQDLTLYGGGLSERGVLAGAEFRYVQDRASRGMVAISYLNDSLTDTPGDDFKSDGVFRTTTDRYWLRGKADHDFGHHLNGKLDIDLVSDQDYLEEYNDGLIGYSESARVFTEEFGRGFEAKTTHSRTNLAQLTRWWPTMTLGGEVRASNDPTSTPSTIHPWSLPSLAFAGSRPLFPSRSAAGLPGPLAATDLVWDTGYVYYWQEGGVGAHRFDLHPSLKAPLPVAPYLETTAALGLRQTMYQADGNGPNGESPASGTLSRTLSDVTLATSTLLVRDFELGGPSLRRLSHLVRPGLSYTYLPAARQDDLPAFDSIDRIGAENLVTYEVSNDFEVETREGGAWKFGYARLSQAYDIHETRRDLGLDDRRRTFTDVAFESWLQPLPELRLIYETDWDIYGDGATNYQLGASYFTPRGDTLYLEHRYDAAQVINQLNLVLSVRLATTLQAQAVVYHSLETDQTSDTSLRLLYQPACWGLALQATTTPDDAYRLSLMFSLEGVGNIMGLSQTLSSSGGWGGI